MSQKEHAKNHSLKTLLEQAYDHYRAGDSRACGKRCEEALKADPESAPALHLLGMLAYQAGQYGIAETRMSRAVALSPDTFSFHEDLGTTLLARDKIDESILCFRNALRLNPNAFRSYCRLGVALKKKGMLDQAFSCLEIALKLKPDDTDALYHKGFASLEKKMPFEAAASFEKLLRMEPFREDALYALGTALAELGRHEEAISRYSEVLELSPDHVHALNNLGLLLKERGEIDRATAAYRQAISIRPDLAAPHWNLSHLLLLSGDLEAGWKEFEWRLQKADWQKANLRTCKAPLWKGESFAGKTLFVHDEQGLGDTIQFARYLPMVKALGGEVFFEVQKPLLPVLHEFPGIDRLLPESEDKGLAEDIDFYAPLLSLPSIFETTLDTIPDTVPYLHADAEKTRSWRKRLERDAFHVGLVWAGRPENPNDKNRSCELSQLAPLSNIEGVRLIGIQKGKAAEQVKTLPSGMEVINFGPELYDFTDTMGLIESLDLVIAVDTAVAHLAGAMGKPVWLVLTFAHHWPWLLGRTDSPWYPSMRIYRQNRKGDWPPVFEQITKDLRTLVEKKGSNLLK